MFRIFVADTKNNRSILAVEKTYEISKIKEIIKITQSIQGDIQIIFNGMILEDSNTLEDYDIRPDDILCFYSEFLAGGKTITNISNNN